jgi:hypothetical protein
LSNFYPIEYAIAIGIRHGWIGAIDIDLVTIEQEVAVTIPV